MRFPKRTYASPLAAMLANGRRLLGLEQAELGAQIGVSARSVSRWETGQWVPARTNHEAVLVAFKRLPPEMLRELTRLLVGVDPGGSVASAAARATSAADAKGVMESLVLQVAEDLDIGPRRVRVAIATVLDGIERAGLSAKAARDALTVTAVAGPAGDLTSAAT
jgi:hypothetical protein